MQDLIQLDDSFVHDIGLVTISPLKVKSNQMATELILSFYVGQISYTGVFVIYVRMPSHVEYRITLL